MTWYGAWLDEVLTAATAGPVVVVGHSLGGAVALACPTPRIRARVAVSTAGLIRLRVTPRLLSATAPWLARPNPDRTRRLLRLMAARTRRSRPPSPRG